MTPTLPLKAALPLTLVATLATAVRGQTAPEWRVGAGFLITRPSGDHLWGVHVQRERRLSGPLVNRGAASLDLVSGYAAFDPLLVTVGTDIGLRARLAPLSALIAVGPTLGYFAARRHYYPCQGPGCVTQSGYEPGFVLVGTGSLALGLRVSSELEVFGEARIHVPSGIGRSGFAGDPHAAFVEAALGVSLQR